MSVKEIVHKRFNIGLFKPFCFFAASEGDRNKEEESEKVFRSLKKHQYSPVELYDAEAPAAGAHISQYTAIRVL
jgi:hypothetical protein